MRDACLFSEAPVPASYQRKEERANENASTSSSSGSKAAARLNAALFPCSYEREPQEGARRYRAIRSGEGSTRSPHAPGGVRGPMSQRQTSAAASRCRCPPHRAPVGHAALRGAT
uniref:PPUP9587 n=1 Tax=Poeciliopsis prolifica TaxID=188132 RepID=A0A0S7EIV9_9TELE